jgi:2-polyprenyl-3-methyl-5-hydroxy-6-metoxy-1,4-benzoquinol methylase
MSTQQHWDHVYGTKPSDQVSWYRPHLETSLNLIKRATREDRTAAIIDVGGGASTLVDDLLTTGFTDITVLDIAATAIDVAKSRLGSRAGAVRWLVADATQPTVDDHSIDVWHDRAVFHFLTAPAARAAYVQNVVRAVRPGGHVIVSTFGPEGPQRCSGLDVVRYDSGALHGTFGPQFKLVESSTELHATPFGTTQQFLYCYCTVR